MTKQKKIIATSLFMVCIFFISGCRVNEKLEWLDNKAGVGLEKLNDNTGDENKDDNKDNEKKELTRDDKDKIDKWIEDNNLNRYGDAMGALYTGGTPLFNEETGESLDRYEYIIKNHVELLDILK